ncbi:hypothetical protein ACW9IB_29320, partial [Pseudomonas sp. SDO524_S393]
DRRIDWHTAFAGKPAPTFLCVFQAAVYLLAAKLAKLLSPSTTKVVWNPLCSRIQWIRSNNKKAVLRG